MGENRYIVAGTLKRRKTVDLFRSPFSCGICSKCTYVASVPVCRRLWPVGRLRYSAEMSCDRRNTTRIRKTRATRRRRRRTDAQQRANTARVSHTTDGVFTARSCSPGLTHRNTHIHTHKQRLHSTYCVWHTRAPRTSRRHGDPVLLRRAPWKWCFRETTITNQCRQPGRSENTARSPPGATAADRGKPHDAPRVGHEEKTKNNFK